MRSIPLPIVGVVATFPDWDSGLRNEPRSVSITTVYDNYAVEGELVTAWGSCFGVSTPEEAVLFDTGGDGRILLANMRTTGLDPVDIDRVVISHGHGDHLGGGITRIEGCLPSGTSWTGLVDTRSRSPTPTKWYPGMRPGAGCCRDKPGRHGSGVQSVRIPKTAEHTYVMAIDRATV